MSEREEPPPPYQEHAPVESTPLIHKTQPRTQRYKVRIAAAALLIPYVLMSFAVFYFFVPVTKEKIPVLPVRIAIIGKEYLTVVLLVVEALC